MKGFLTDWKKQIEIAVLIALVLVIDLLKIDDAPLKYMAMGLVSTLTGWHGLNALIARNSDTPQISSGISVTPAPALGTVITIAGSQGSGGGSSSVSSISSSGGGVGAGGAPISP